MLNRAEKKEFVNNFNVSIGSAKILLISHYKGLTVSEISELRRLVKEQNANFKVTKNTLAKLALKDTCYEKLDKFFSGPTAVTYSDDPASAAKAVFNFSKENQSLEILGGAIGDKELTVDEIKTLADLPSIDELRAKIVGVISSPLRSIVSLLNQPSRSIVTLLSKKE
ncbi:MAG: 50S ribosomal protein L10 [Rickettsiales bacterium]|nr:50S ribosomal protein L10 [Rickettsiales bacterium]